MPVEENELGAGLLNVFGGFATSPFCAPSAEELRPPNLGAFAPPSLGLPYLDIEGALVGDWLE